MAPDSISHSSLCKLVQKDRAFLYHMIQAESNHKTLTIWEPDTSWQISSNKLSDSLPHGCWALRLALVQVGIAGINISPQTYQGPLTSLREQPTSWLCLCSRWTCRNLMSLDQSHWSRSLGWSVTACISKHTDGWAFEYWYVTLQVQQSLPLKR